MRALVRAMASPVSRRVTQTDDPIIVTMQALLRSAPEGTVSLAQGVVHWPPPSQALDAARQVVGAQPTNVYGPDEGSAELRALLRSELDFVAAMNNSEVMVTAGANQAYVNAVLATVDPGDATVLFAPYYFNHKMALQMCGHGEHLLIGPARGPSLLPDMDWLEHQFEERSAAGSPNAVRLVTLCSPCNPTGTVLPQQLLDRAQALCRKHGAWLFLDHAYAHFCADGSLPSVPGGEGVLSSYSFSKAFGMAGWRIGCLAHPPSLGPELLKVQDTLVICPSAISQAAAVGALKAGNAWVKEQVESLAANRASIRRALEPLGTANIVGGEGAIYFLAKLPEGMDDERVVRWLLHQHRVAVIPASFCGAPGYVRVCYSNLPTDACAEAAGRLRTAMEQVVRAAASPDSAPHLPGEQL